MSLAISIVVIICMAVSFAVLFFLYGRTKSKGIDFGVEDNSIRNELSQRLTKRGGGAASCTQMLADGKKKERIIRIVTDAFLIILIALAGALTIFSFVLRGKGEQIYFGDTAYLTVLTSSMQEKNDNNPYLRENDDGVRIHRYALIGIDKVDPADLKVGDIIAFKYEGDTIYVHRIIAVREAGESRFFTTMGDANDVSSPNETNISADRIVGVFNGYHRGYLGVLLIYMRSDIGMVALIFVFLLLAVIDAAEWFITRSYEKRQQVLANEIDGAVPPAENDVQTGEPQQSEESETNTVVDVYGFYEPVEYSADYSVNITADAVVGGYNAGNTERAETPKKRKPRKKRNAAAINASSQNGESAESVGGAQTGGSGQVPAGDGND